MSQDPLHVLLIGWMGSQRRHVEKYAQMYERAAGVRCTILIAEPKDVMLVRREGLLQCGLRGLQQVVDASPSGPIVIHTFSNGGAFVWNFLVRLMYGQDPPPQSVTSEQRALVEAVRQRLCAEIFDSAPGYMYFTSGLQAIGASFPKNAPARLVLQALFASFALSSALYCRVTGQLTQPEDYWARCKDWPTETPHLYIYSPLDPLCDVAMLEAHIESVKNTGRKVECLRFDDTEHVLHFKKHPTEYAAACFAMCQLQPKVD